MVFILFPFYSIFTLFHQFQKKFLFSLKKIFIIDYHCGEDYFQTNFFQNVIADKNSPELSIGRLIRRIVMDCFLPITPQFNA